MGGNKRRHKKRKEVVPSASCTEGETNHDDGDDDHRIVVHIECAKDDKNPQPPPVWSTEFVENIQKKLPSNIPSVSDVGLQLVRGTLEKISSRRCKKLKKKKNKGSNQSSSTIIDTTSVAVKPTPIQLRMWPALLHSFESHDKSMNVVGIAPTGTGKTMSYSIPIISHCVRSLLLCYHQTKHQHKTITKHTNSTMVHGIVLVPTRELAIQVSKEIHVIAKVANKYLSKYCRSFKDDDINNNDDDVSDTTTMRVDSLPIYGGVDIETQISSIVGPSSSSLSSTNHNTSLVLAATAGRLLDILKQTSHSKVESSTVAEILIAFSNLQAIVFDEADRIAVNSDMASDVDEIISILKNVQVNDNSESADGTKWEVVSCLVSATLPDKAKEVCEKWVPRTRVIVKVDSVNVGDKKQQQKLDMATKAGEESKETGGGYGNNDEVSPKKMQSADDQDKKIRHSAQNLDLASIPSNIVQTLHVCSSHKKPKKLILTLQRIYTKKKTDTKSHGERFSANNRLTIVFFSQIKTVKYISKLLAKEGLRCVELYGSLQQSDREKRLLEFKAGKTPILLATDIAARGIHISNVNYVVNYDFPGALDQYVHRCGRAGRKQALSGEVSQQYPPTVYSFFPREFSAMADSVIELLKACNAWVDPNLLALSKENKSADKKSSSEVQQKKKRKREHNNTDSDGGKERRKAGRDSEDTVESDDDDIDQFSFLGKSVLKRASHVSDADDDSDDGDC